MSAQGVWQVPFAVSGATGAVGVLLGDGHDGRTYDVTGPEAILHQVAEDLSQVIGRGITYRAETLDEACASRASYGAPEWEVLVGRALRAAGRR
jgi:NAD(P)H dehydrogenase (quinone)